MLEKDSKFLKPELDKAGAGLPKVRVLLAKCIMFPLLNRFISWERTWDNFDKEGAKVMALVRPLSQEQLSKRVLVPKLFGLEDNSRYYSVAMVLDHLLMVGGALQIRIPLLSKGTKISKKIKIEDVKPYHEISQTIVEDFEKFLATYRKKLEKNVQDIHLDNTSLHPWFGAFNPKQWSILAMVHQRVHRRQVEAIIKRLE